MSSSAKTLDPTKKGVKRHIIEIDIDALPDDLAAAYLESRKPYRHDAPTRARISKHRRDGIKLQKMVWTNKREKTARKGVWKTDGGTAARLLALAGDWITRHELRVALGVYRGLLSKWLDQLWKDGRLLKRKNPAWCGKPGLGAGVARCEYQYKRASIQVDHAPQSDQHESGKAVKDAGDKA